MAALYCLSILLLSVLLVSGIDEAVNTSNQIPGSRIAEERQQEGDVDANGIIPTNRNGQSCPNMNFGRREGPLYVAFQLPEGEEGTTVSYEGGRAYRAVRGVCYILSWSDHTFVCEAGEYVQTRGSWPTALALPEDCVNGGGAIENGIQDFLQVENDVSVPFTNAPTSSPVMIIRPILTETEVPTGRPSTMAPTKNPTPGPTLLPTTAAPTDPAVTVLDPSDSTTPAPTENTIQPTPQPTSKLSSSTITTTETIYCGCLQCTQAVWDRLADSYSCGQRISFLSREGTPLPEACRQVGTIEFPEACGACVCDETDANGSTGTATPPASVVSTGTATTTATPSATTATSASSSANATAQSTPTPLVNTTAGTNTASPSTEATATVESGGDNSPSNLQIVSEGNNMTIGWKLSLFSIVALAWTLLPF